MPPVPEDPPPPSARRELRTRGAGWPHAVARALASVGIKPNHVSIASLVFAAIAAWAFYRVGRYPMRSGNMFIFMGERIRRWRTYSAWWLVLGAAGIQL